MKTNACTRSRRHWALPFAGVVVAAIAVPGASAVAGSASQLELVRSVVSGGGDVLSSNGELTLSGTIGQADDAAGAMHGGDFALRVGFWLGGEAVLQQPIFGDGFESGGVSAWSSSRGAGR